MTAQNTLELLLQRIQGRKSMIKALQASHRLVIQDLIRSQTDVTWRAVDVVLYSVSH